MTANPIGASKSTLVDKDYDEADNYASLSVLSDREDALLELLEAYRRAEENGWDGFGASRADVDAYICTAKFLKALPESMPDPEIDVTPQGKFMLHWRREGPHMFTMTIGALGEIAFAARFGRTKRSGTAIFADFIPRHIIDELSELYADS